MFRLWSFCLILIHCVTAPVLGGFIQALIGDTVEFSETSVCDQTHGVKLEHRLDDKTAVPVASRHDGGVWRPEPGYEDRMQPGFIATLRSVNMNDDGVYELTCGGFKIIQVEVVQFQVVDVTEGEMISLPCYHKTSGSDEAAMWERKSQERVLKFSSNQTEYGAGLERRASLSPDAFKQGNLSLTLETRLEDDGDYFCFVEKSGKKQRGSPAAVRLKVRPVQTRTTTTSTTPAPPQTKHTGPEDKAVGLWTIVVTAVVTFVITAIVFTVIGWKWKSWFPNGTCRQNIRQDQNNGEASQPKHNHVMQLLN